MSTGRKLEPEVSRAISELTGLSDSASEVDVVTAIGGMSRLLSAT